MEGTEQLTVNYGVRWDRIRPWQEKFNQLQTLVKGEQSQVFPGAPQGLVFPGDPGVPRSLAPARNNLAPRIGIVWSPSPAVGSLLEKFSEARGKTSIRLGYGMFYTAYEGLVGRHHERESAVWLYVYFCCSAAVCISVHGGSNGRGFRTKVSAAAGGIWSEPRASECEVDWSQFEPLVGIPAVDPNDVTPYAEHWMASVERQVGASTLATVSYVGASAHHLLALEEANPADPALCLSLGSGMRTV